MSRQKKLLKLNPSLSPDPNLQNNLDIVSSNFSEVFRRFDRVRHALSPPITTLAGIILGPTAPDAGVATGGLEVKLDVLQNRPVFIFLKQYIVRGTTVPANGLINCYQTPTTNAEASMIFGIFQDANALYIDQVGSGCSIANGAFGFHHYPGLNTVKACDIPDTAGVRRYFFQAYAGNPANVTVQIGNCQLVAIQFL